MSIQILPAQLANQIAAGEVVERPSSVVKELLENSLDAGATEIEIEIDKGGHKRILLRDNGKGITKEDLNLALSRHATSKISTLEDLEKVTSMGFRGEALASISSVSRLTLISRTAEQSEAWQAVAEGRDMSVNVTPAAHPIGTTLLVEDLFFNTPARRKFLKSEKTEFAHIDEVIRRIALGRFDVSISVKHNGKLLRKYPAAKKGADPYKRIGKACGQRFCDHALEVESQYQDMTLRGWLVNVVEAQTPIETQYFYVNGRIMRDKLINHAIKQAFSLMWGDEVQPAYILYLELPATAIDINVHPSKHEVRFHQARLVHDFIVRTIQEFLRQADDMLVGDEETRNAESSVKVFEQAVPNHDYIQPLKPVDSGTNERTTSYGSSSGSVGGYRAPSFQSSAGKQYRELLQPSTTQESAFEVDAYRWLKVGDNRILLEQDSQFYIMSHASLAAIFWTSQLASHLPPAQPLLLPISVSIEAQQGQSVQVIIDALATLNIDLNLVNKKLMLRKVPAGMRDLDWAAILSFLISLSNEEVELDKPAHMLGGAVASTHIKLENSTIERYLCLTQDETTNTLLKLYTKEVPLTKWLDEQGG
ncbi:DNA mismatch repair endonuclease MutL [Alteromonadaceae bacterium M269]|nr:DNA mismatch repair endonuclease MutL [Alteromonadaceae bacterium M269]